MRSDCISPRRWALLGASLCAVAFASASASGAATATGSRQALLRARSEIAASVSPRSAASVKSAAKAAERALTAATAIPLWIGSTEIAAPPYGASVFTHSATALGALVHTPSLRSEAGSIVAADRALATSLIAEARGGNHRLLSSAQRALTAGDREAADRPAVAVRSYAAAWRDAFGALTRLVLAQATHVPRAALAAAAENALGSKLIGLAGPMIVPNQPPLTAAGKPEVFFAGSEACPFCAVQRWGMIAALAQFGTFSNLHLIQSTSLEPPPVETFTFLGSSYRSAYVAFVPVEIFSNVPARLGFRHLQRPTPTESALIERYDQSASVPFIDVANRFLTVQSTVEPPPLAGLPWRKIGASLRNPKSIPAQAIAGEAEVLTAEICEATNGEPSSICSRQVVRDYEDALPRLNGQGGGCPASAADAAIRPRGLEPVASAAHCHRG